MDRDELEARYFNAYQRANMLRDALQQLKERVASLHVEEVVQGNETEWHRCSTCRTTWPCATRRVVSS